MVVAAICSTHILALLDKMSYQLLDCCFISCRGKNLVSKRIIDMQKCYCFKGVHLIG